MDQKSKIFSAVIKWIAILILLRILLLTPFLSPRQLSTFIVFAAVLLFIVFTIFPFPRIVVSLKKNANQKNEVISYTRVYSDATRKRDIKKDKYKDKYRDYKREKKTNYIKETTPYTYTTPHTEAKINETRNLPFQGTLYLDNIDIGSAIGLIKLANKLVGIKDITLQLMTGEGAVVMDIEANDKGILKFKVQSPSAAIKILRKVYSDYNTTKVSGKIRLRHTKGNKVQTLLEIAQDTYKARIYQDN